MHIFLHPFADEKTEAQAGGNTHSNLESWVLNPCLSISHIYTLLFLLLLQLVTKTYGQWCRCHHKTETEDKQV